MKSNTQKQALYQSISKSVNPIHIEDLIPLLSILNERRLISLELQKETTESKTELLISCLNLTNEKVLKFLNIPT